MELRTSQSDFGNNSSTVSVKKCPKCAEDIKVEAVKCRFCGSDLGPKGIEKTNLLVSSFLNKYPPKNHVFEMMALTLVLTAIGILIFNYTTKSRELNALKETGQVCVIDADNDNNYGCADYPQLKFDVCTDYKYVDWYALVPNYTLISGDTERSIGKMIACTSRNPYLYSFDYTLDDSLRVGEYSVYGNPYEYFSATESIEGAFIDGLVIKVSLK
jgi:hypothetical protein